jgi:predicted nuclease with TOPRIM domain
MFNLLRDQLSTAQTEKDALYTQITSLTAEIRMLRDENKRYRTEDKSSSQQLQTTLNL